MQLASGDDGVATAVVVVEPTGADTQVFTKIAGVEVTSVFRERHEFRPGEIIRLRPDPARAHLFDAGTGMRLAT
jgi:multiple sugar transport system ATP-binding protein